MNLHLPADGRRRPVGQTGDQQHQQQTSSGSGFLLCVAGLTCANHRINALVLLHLQPGFPPRHTTFQTSAAAPEAHSSLEAELRQPPCPPAGTREMLRFHRRRTQVFFPFLYFCLVFFTQVSPPTVPACFRCDR